MPRRTPRRPPATTSPARPPRAPPASKRSQPKPKTGPHAPRTPPGASLTSPPATPKPSTEHAALEAAPAEIAARAASAAAELEVAQAAHRQAAKTLEQAANDDHKANRDARAAEQALATARENIVRAEAAAEAANHAWGTVAERILEKLGANAQLPNPPADIGPDAEDRARRRWERQQKERDEMGPVNMRAEIEAEEIQTRINGIDGERAELNTAIAKLRGSIGHLNREGRERLTTVFQQVDKHFQSLFARMFNGGRAHLAMVGLG